MQTRLTLLRMTQTYTYVCVDADVPSTSARTQTYTYVCADAGVPSTSAWDNAGGQPGPVSSPGGATAVPTPSPATRIVKQVRIKGRSTRRGTGGSAELVNSPSLVEEVAGMQQQRATHPKPPHDGWVSPFGRVTVKSWLEDVLKRGVAKLFGYTYNDRNAFMWHYLVCQPYLR